MGGGGGGARAESRRMGAAGRGERVRGSASAATVRQAANGGLLCLCLLCGCAPDYLCAAAQRQSGTPGWARALRARTSGSRGGGDSLEGLASQDGHSILGGGVGDGQKLSGQQHLRGDGRGRQQVRQQSAARARSKLETASCRGCRLAHGAGVWAASPRWASRLRRPHNKRRQAGRPTLSMMYSSEPQAERGSPSTLTTWPVASVMV